jgi:hypothetical protein
MDIFILTRGRFNKQTTIKNIHAFDWCKPYIIVPTCERHLWVKQVPLENLVSVPDEYKAGDIRQFILEYNDNRHLVLDDDLSFYRREKDTVKLKQLTKGDFKDMIKTIDEYMDHGFHHGAISAREGNNRVEMPYVTNTRAMRALFYDAKIVKNLGVRWDGIKCRMDFHFTLSMMLKGKRNIVNYEFAQNQNGSATVGGATWYRKAELMDDMAYRLQDMFPEFVTAVEKTTKTSFGGGTRIDVRIAWKKAYEEGVRRSSIRRKKYILPK